MTLHKKLTVLAVILVASGVAGLLPFNYYWLKSKVALAQNSAVYVPQSAKLNPSPNLITGMPISISIPRLKINLGVIPGYYNSRDGSWTLTSDKAQFATPSVQPNNITGNMLIYGHYRPEVFAYLHLIKPGDVAVITTSNGNVFTYSYDSTQAFDETNTSVFRYDGPARLTIQTCSGSFMQHRQMYYFKLDSVKKL